ncbi:MAG: hypothetical protein ABJA20_02805 [Novosphingobium sp.]
MTSHFSFDGRIGRLPFILAGGLLFLGQQCLAHVLRSDYLFSLTPFANAILAPLHFAWFGLFDRIEAGQNLAYAILVGLILLTDWGLSALAFRRAQTTSAHPFVAALIVVPFVQPICLIWLLCKSEREQTDAEPTGFDWRSSLIGMLAGAGIGVGAAAFFTLVLGDYGATLFLGVPLFVGFAASYVANGERDIGRHSRNVAFGALLLGGLALIGFALEGLICLLMASPLILAMGWIGAAIGRTWVIRRSYKQSTMLGIVAIPFLMGIGVFEPPHSSFESSESIEIAATPAQVWDSVIHMGPIPAAPAAPFGWGLAYPVRGTINGTGIGAVREGVFSTGVAYERVTEWEAARKLTFVVLSDPPMMRELSPYSHVNAPHTVGYFRTKDARFTITPLPNGKTRLTLATLHELDIGPTIYWQRFAEWAVHANKVRVLRHFRDQAERPASHAPIVLRAILPTSGARPG